MRGVALHMGLWRTNGPLTCTLSLCCRLGTAALPRLVAPREAHSHLVNSLVHFRVAYLCCIRWRRGTLACTVAQPCLLHPLMHCFYYGTIFCAQEATDSHESHRMKVY